MKGLTKSIARWFTGLFKVWRREFRLVFTDAGVLLFFFALPTLYPVVYTLIYNPEVVKKMSVVVVDHSSTARSREFVRVAGQTEAIDIIGYAANMQEARKAMHEHECFAILEIPQDFARRIGNGEQAVVPFYCDMSLLLRFRQFTVALTDVQIATGAKIAQQKLEDAGLPGQTVEPLASPIETEAVFLGDPTQGFASFVMPGILVLILQQSLILGITMISGGHSERRRRNRGYDPMWVSAPASAIVLGKTLCYLVLYLPMLVYTLHIVPWMFRLPHYGSFFEAVLLMVPMLVATSMFGQVLSAFVTERESSLLVVVFSSVVFLFLSGLTWPRYAMNPFWVLMGDAVPATWGVEGFVRINSDSGSLAEQGRPLGMLWLLSAVYFAGAVAVQWWRSRMNVPSAGATALPADEMRIP